MGTEGAAGGARSYLPPCAHHPASSTGLLLKTLGLKVTAIKIDPYMNIDAGTMAPTEHGEVFVLDDGGEVDLDLGNYERYLNVTLSRENNITTGKIYKEVIEKEVCREEACRGLCRHERLTMSSAATWRLPRQDGADCSPSHHGHPGLD